jgi:nucleoside-diphosphate-sugar epimerase
MKVLVTGATGFAGGALTRRLIEQGDQVVALVRSRKKATELTNMGVECREVDITDRPSVLSSFDDSFDRIFHIAALYRSENSDIRDFQRVNVEGTRNLLDAAKATGVGRFIHCSTVGVQGRIEEPPAAETYRFAPEDHYQESKLEGEKLAREYFAAGLPGVVVRPAGIYGPGDMRFLKLFKAIERGWFMLIGNGQTLYHFTYIDDLLDGFLLAANHPRAAGEVFTIASRSHTTVGHVVDQIADILDKPRPRLRIPAWPVTMAAVLCVGLCRPFGISPPLYPRRLEFFTMDRAFTIEKAETMLGHDPKVEIREGLERTAAWYRNANLL